MLILFFFGFCSPFKITCASFWYGYLMFQTMGSECRVNSPQSPFQFLLTCRSSVKRIQLKKTSGALSSIPTPPGVDCGSKLRNMFVLTLPFSIQRRWAEKFNFFVLGIPVHGTVMKPHFQKYGVESMVVMSILRELYAC